MAAVSHQLPPSTEEDVAKNVRRGAVALIIAFAAGTGIVIPTGAQAAPTYWTFHNFRFNTCLTGGDSGTAFGTLCNGEPLRV